MLVEAGLDYILLKLILAKTKFVRWKKMGEEKRKSHIIWANNWTKADLVLLTSKNVSGEPQKADK